MANFFGTLFGGASEKAAAAKNLAALGAYGTNATGALNTGYKDSVGAVTAGNASANKYFGDNYDLYDDMRTAGTGILDRGKADSLAALNGITGIYDPMRAKYGAGTDLYLDSLGVRGPEGNARAVQNFQAGPGYEFTRDQGIEALNRRRAASGMLNSGNADIDALKYGTGLANQTYGGWQDRLAGLINPEFTAAGGAAGGRSAIANMVGADTLARLNLEGAVTGGQAGSNTARAANDVALGNTLAGLHTGHAGNLVGVEGNKLSGTTAANNMVAAGEIGGAKNILNAGMGLANLAAGAFGGGGMFGAGGSFGGGAPTAMTMGGVPYTMFGK